MQKPKTFIFESYELDRKTGVIRLRYAFDDMYRFEERIELPSPPPQDIPEEEVEAALLALHLIGGVSYYKAFCPPELVVKSGRLDAGQARFWQTVYEKGLGEFSFQNQLDLRGKIVFPVSEGAQTPSELPMRERPVPQRVLSLFGGGKDSMATADILNAAGVDYTFMRVGAHPVIEALFAKLGRPQITVKRSLDPQLFELNRQGALNGHIPITTYIATLNIVLALMYGFEAVVISSERSSSYGNVQYLGEEINHQWSKSSEFEQLFSDYVARYVTQRVDYVNILASLSELQIAKIVTADHRFLHNITSCNVNWKWMTENRLDTDHHGLWCGRCPKCAFTFALFAAWLPLAEVTEIFGQNLFDAAENEDLYRELFGLVGFKPFECVGTPDEMVAAVYLAIQREDISQTLVGRMYTTEVLPKVKHPEKAAEEALMVSDVLKDQPAYVSKWLRLKGVIEA